MYEPHEFSLCNIHVIPNCLLFFFQASEKGKTDNDIDFNPLMPGDNKKVTYTSTTLQLKAPGLFKYVLLPGIKALKYFEPPIVVEQFWIVLNKQNDIFEFRIFSHPLFSQPLNGISSPKNNPSPRHISQLKKAFEKYNCELLFAILRYCFNCYVDWTNL